MLRRRYLSKRPTDESLRTANEQEPAAKAAGSRASVWKRASVGLALAGVASAGATSLAMAWASIAGTFPVLASAGAPASLATSGGLVGCQPTGIGDRLHPRLGTRDVRVLSYDARLAFAPGLASFTARTTIRVRAVRPFECTRLDFAGGEVRRVMVGGVAADFRTVAEKLLVRLPRSMRTGEEVRITVDTTSFVPAASDLDLSDFPPGVVRLGDTVQVIAQPSRAHRLVPMADHPSQKAPWRITVDAPEGLVGVVSGHLIRRTSHGNTTRTVYRTAPIATHVLQVAVGPFVQVRDGRVNGVQLRSWVPRAEVAATARARTLMRQHLAFLEGRLGAYPFDEYGVLATELGGELEHQTLSLLSVGELRKPVQADGVMMHELSHQWFGDSVSVGRWRDLWLAEGHAVYYEALWSNQLRPDHTLSEVFGRMRISVLAALRSQGPIAAPRRRAFQQPALAPYGPVAYQGGAVALYGLQQDVGPTTFERIERRFVRTYRHRSATTEDYLRIVRQVAGPGPAKRLRSVLFGTTIPQLR